MSFPSLPPLWTRTRRLHTEPFRSPHVLDLKLSKGSLREKHLDFPRRSVDRNMYYLRRQERWTVPPSYRTGMAFFVTVMVLSSLGLTAVDAYSVSSQRQQLLGAQIIQGLDDLRSGWQETQDEAAPDNPAPFADIPDIIVEQDPIPELLSDESPSPDHELVTWNLNIRKGFQAFDAFLSNWEKESQRGFLSKMKLMRKSSQDALSFWHKVLGRAQEIGLEFFALDQRQPLQQTLALIDDLSHFLSVFEHSYDSLLTLLGTNGPQRILVMIQDDAQLMPGGGALSAGVEMLLDDGEILAWRPFHVNDYDALLRVPLQPPRGYDKLTEQWNLSTANAFEDMSQSARQIEWFWERQARSTVDLIVFVSTSGLERFFIDSGVYEHLKVENVSEIENIDLKWTLARIHGDQERLTMLSSLLIDSAVQIFQQPEWTLQSWPILEDLLHTKQITLFSAQKKLQANLVSAGVSGTIPSLPAKEDLLMVSSLNQENFGSDRWIDDNVILHTSIDTTGKIKHWLKLTRQHLWSSEYSTALQEQLGQALSSQELAELGAHKNTSMMRILVPQGSQVLDVSGIERTALTQQNTDLGVLWTFSWTVSPGETQEMAITYELPWTFDTDSVDNYRLHLVQHTNKKPIGFQHDISFPQDLSIFQEVPSTPLRRLVGDQTIAIVAGKNP